jgi:hypothetical protein
VIVAEHVIRARGGLRLAQTQSRVVGRGVRICIADLGRRTLGAATFSRAVSADLRIASAQLAIDAGLLGFTGRDANVVVLQADFTLLAVTIRRATFVAGKFSPLIAIVFWGVADLAEVTSAVAALGLRSIRTPTTRSTDVPRILGDLTNLTVCAVTVIFTRRDFFTLALLTGVFDV